MSEYVRKVQYYETDKMGIVHHSNYIRWMEEARMDFLEKAGLPFRIVEDRGISVPVVSVSADYKAPCFFGDELTIGVGIEKYDGVRLTFRYEMRRNEDGKLVSRGISEHCFIRDGRLCSLKKADGQIHALMKAEAARGNET